MYALQPVSSISSGGVGSTAGPLGSTFSSNVCGGGIPVF